MQETATTAIDWAQIWIITGVGYTVVFLALLLLMFLFNKMPLILDVVTGKKVKVLIKKMKADNGNEEDQYLSGEISAAIGMALTLYFKEQHDEESGVITIKRVARTYSPWSSKIYGVNNNPR
ncbi:MAG: OadG family transporter subunit [Salinimicrobium sediminis]|nr:OadG family transporter subunit [Salinimicrobium sediminis]MDX1752313.1 OadG family transporter subunit [Salinimicrobium sediminis]